MAYVDGALPPDESSEIRALLLKDPSLQVRVDALREGAELVRNALDGVLSEPLPEDLLTQIEMAGQSGEKANRRVLGAPPARWVIPVRLVEIAAAACFLLVAGGYIGHWIGSGDGQRTALDPRIAAALTSTTSGTVAPLETDGTSEDVMPCSRLPTRTAGIAGSIFTGFRGREAARRSTGWHAATDRARGPR